MSIPFLLVVLVAAAFLTGAMRRYALSRKVLDVPNERSSHSTPTPRGGGVAIVVVFLAAVAFLGARGGIPSSIAIALAGSGLLVALVGFVDDHGYVEVHWRLLAHFAAAAWGLWCIGGMPVVVLMGARLETGPLGNLVALLGLVWLLNLYNFMDGIDGIAGVEAVSVTAGAALLAQLAVASPEGALLPALLGAASLGFLAWNLPPARIFMGDAGSGFVGLMLGLLAVDAGHQAPALLWGWVILLGVFVVDATVTLVTRALRRVPVHIAHRSHAYQHAAAQTGSHGRVTLAVGLINVIWLLPWAVAAVRGVVPGAVALAAAYTPLVPVALWLRAGHDGPAPTQQEAPRGHASSPSAASPS